MPLFLSLPAPEVPGATIVVTAARQPVEREEAPASISIFDAAEIERLNLPAITDFLRLVPGASVSVSGPRGTQAQLRIRGAEANHSLLFVDGIRFNDPASGNEPRFELLTADLASRIELIRGPQSALWGADALGGVVAIEGTDPLDFRGFAGLAEIGSHETLRLAGRAGFGDADGGIVASGGWQKSEGFDSFGSGGDRDGFDSRSFGLKAARLLGPVRLSLAGHHVEGVSQYDGFDPFTFQRADTLDVTRNRISAVRAAADLDLGHWTARADVSYLDSANVNRLDGAPLNASFGDRLTVGAQVAHSLSGHDLIAAIEHQSEGFRGRDTQYGGATAQERRRRSTGLVAQWRARWHSWLITDLALRHDAFDAFADATSLRASLQVRPIEPLAAHFSYGEGIAQPSFYDLYGYFPASFEGNPALRAERSRGWEAGLSWQADGLRLGLVYHQARLRDEIVDVFDPATFLSSTDNASGVSRRRGVELTGEWRVADGLQLGASYAWLDADEQKVDAGAIVKEIRRPRHSFSLSASGRLHGFSWGLAGAYVGARRDTDFDLFPAANVRLDDYFLASFNLARRIAPGIDANLRIENALDSEYQDVVGYRTAGRTVHAGLRVAFGD